MARDYKMLVNETNRTYLSKYPFEKVARALGIIMARNLRQVHDLTPTRVRESTVVAHFADFADVDMHAPPAFIMLSRKRNQEFLFQGVDLEVTFFGIFCPSGPLRATSFFVCLRRLCLRRSPGVTQVLRLSLSLSLTLSLFQVRSGPSLRFF